MHPPTELYEEVAFIAYYFNWGHSEVLGLPHWERKRWCEEISRINDERNDDGGPGSSDPFEGFGDPI